MGRSLLLGSQALDAKRCELVPLGVTLTDAHARDSVMLGDWSLTALAVAFIVL